MAALEALVLHLDDVRQRVERAPEVRLPALRVRLVPPLDVLSCNDDDDDDDDDDDADDEMRDSSKFTVAKCDRHSPFATGLWVR